MTDDELFERLAAIEHERWADWQRYLHSRCALSGPVCNRIGDGFGRRDLVIPAELVGRWERQIATPYADLSEREKEADREQVRRYWPLIRPEATD